VAVHTLRVCLGGAVNTNNTNDRKRHLKWQSIALPSVYTCLRNQIPSSGDNTRAAAALPRPASNVHCRQHPFRNSSFLGSKKNAMVPAFGFSVGDFVTTIGRSHYHQYILLVFYNMWERTYRQGQQGCTRQSRRCERVSTRCTRASGLGKDSAASATT
jgi:hypothetical protein